MKKVGADWKKPNRPHFQIRDVDKLGLLIQWQILNHGGLQEGDTTDLLCI